MLTGTQDAKTAIVSVESYGIQNLKTENGLTPQILLLLLPLILLSCSKKDSEAERRAHVKLSANVPFQITVVETPEAKEQKAIGVHALDLLHSKAFDDLERYAIKYRSSRDCYADGTWKLLAIYDAIASPGGSSDTDWQTRQREIQGWMDARPLSVTARIAMARLLRNYAWGARGGGYADSVSAQNWRIFSDRLHQGLKVLNDSRYLELEDPVYWSTALGIALGLQVSKDQYDVIFKHAVLCEPDYEPFYETRAVYLLPRWNGAQGEWERDLAQSADKIGGEQGDMLYAQVVWGIHHYGSSDNVFDENPQISWDRVDQGFTVIEKSFPNSLAAKNERAHLAALYGDKEKARKYFIQTQGAVDLSDWQAKGEFVDFANWVFAP